MGFMEMRVEPAFRKWATHASLCSSAHGHVGRVTPIMVAAADRGRIARVIASPHVRTRLLLVDA